MSARASSSKYGHLKPGDKVLVSVVATIASVDHWSYFSDQNSEHDFTTIAYTHHAAAKEGGEAKDATFALELPESPADGNGVAVTIIHD